MFFASQRGTILSLVAIKFFFRRHYRGADLESIVHALRLHDVWPGVELRSEGSVRQRRTRWRSDRFYRVVRCSVLSLGKVLDKMKEAELLVREMIEKIPSLAWSCQPDGTADFLNQRWLDYTGLSTEEAVGWGWQAAIHSEDLGKLMDTWLRLLATGEPGEVEERLRRFDGITVEDIVRLYAFEQGDLETLRRAVRVASLSESWRDYFRHQLKERGG